MAPLELEKELKQKLYLKIFKTTTSYQLEIYLRSKIEKKMKLQIKLKEIMASGKLVSDDILNKIVAEKLLNECQKGFILDGYPRTIEQSKFLNNFLE